MQAQWLMTSRIMSRIEYLVQTDTILMRLFTLKFDSKSSFIAIFDTIFDIIPRGLLSGPSCD